jgi:hypothetical protein
VIRHGAFERRLVEGGGRPARRMALPERNQPLPMPCKLNIRGRPRTQRSRHAVTNAGAWRSAATTRQPDAVDHRGSDRWPVGRGPLAAGRPSRSLTIVGDNK